MERKRDFFVLKLHQAFKSCIVLIFAVLIISACSNESPQVATVEQNDIEEVANGQSAIEQNPPASTDFPRTITDHAGHEITIEKQPERIAVGHFAEMEYFFALGIPPIASPLAEEILQEFTVTIGSDAANAEVADLGDVVSPNLEMLLEIKPDLFIGTIGLHDEVYDQLRAIAPVVMFDSAGEWDERLREYATLAGKEAHAEEYIEKITALIEEASEKLQPYQDETTALLRFSGPLQFGAMGSEPYKLYYDQENGLGFKAPDGYPATWQVLDLEGLSSLDPDHLVIFEYTSNYGARLEDLEPNRVWNNLRAVKNDNVHFVDVSAATNGPYAIPYAIQTLVDSFTQ